MNSLETNFEESRWLKINKLDISKFACKFWVKKANAEAGAWVKAYKFQEEYVPVDDDPYSLYPIDCSTGFDGCPNIIPILSYAALESIIPASERFSVSKNFSEGVFKVENFEFAPFQLDLENSFELIKWLNTYFRKELLEKIASLAITEVTSTSLLLS
ncbi:MAG: hypothetical protein HRT47_11640 [Candidatus Caenarcaniphilales bacterium]|nr:hypothetical protein [Candidatus Caenarcaniphilales bacterium]